jgi:hypothetical protein
MPARIVDRKTAIQIEIPAAPSAVFHAQTARGPTTPERPASSSRLTPLRQTASKKVFAATDGADGVEHADGGALGEKR